MVRWRIYFKRLEVLHYALRTNENKVIEAALEAGADDILTGSDGSLEVLTALENFALDHAEITQRALDVTIPR